MPPINTPNRSSLLGAAFALASFASCERPVADPVKLDAERRVIELLGQVDPSNLSNMDLTSPIEAHATERIGIRIKDDFGGTCEIGYFDFRDKGSSRQDLQSVDILDSSSHFHITLNNEGADRIGQVIRDRREDLLSIADTKIAACLDKYRLSEVSLEQNWPNFDFRRVDPKPGGRNHQFIASVDGVELVVGCQKEATLMGKDIGLYQAALGCTVGFVTAKPIVLMDGAEAKELFEKIASRPPHR